MALSLEEGLQLIRKTIIKQLRHIDYKRVNDLAMDYTTFTTGEGVERKLKQFVIREDDKLFEQRKQLTQITTPDTCFSLLTPMFKVGRTHAQKTLLWLNTEDSANKKNILNNAINNFYGMISVDNYLGQRLAELDATDPNSFIVVEFTTDTNGNVDKVYPFEVNSCEAIDYKYFNNELQYLTVKTAVEKEYEGKCMMYERYTMYLDNNSIVYEQLTKDELKALQSIDGVEVFTNGEGALKKHYLVSVYEHKSGFVPAYRVGTRRDLTTRNRTYVPVIHAAFPYLEKQIKTVSEFDLTNCLHTFPQKIQYDEVCGGDMKLNKPCNGGQTLDGGVCGVCGGSGWKTHTTTQDIIRVRLPDEPKDLVSLDSYMTYKAPPIDLIKFQKDLGLYELKALAMKAVYNGEMFATDSTAQTATAVQVDFENVYDTLKPFADTMSEAWRFIVRLIATYKGIGNGLVVEHSFPKDFKLKSIEQLLADLQQANTSNAPAYIKSQINKDLASKIYTDNPAELMKLNVKEKFFPFVGKSENEIIFIISQGLTTEYSKVLYSNYETIFATCEQITSKNDLNFYELSFDTQKAMIDEQVQIIIDELNGNDLQAMDNTNADLQGNI